MATAPLTEKEMIERDIKTLQESLFLDFKELSDPLTEFQRENLVKHLHWLIEELKILILRLERI
jgi:hypothetical protein